jgi:hypothetical protein
VEKAPLAVDAAEVATTAGLSVHNEVIHAVAHYGHYIASGAGSLVALAQLGKNVWDTYTLPDKIKLLKKQISDIDVKLGKPSTAPDDPPPPPAGGEALVLPPLPPGPPPLPAPAPMLAPAPKPAPPPPPAPVPATAAPAPTSAPDAAAPAPAPPKPAAAPPPPPAPEAAPAPAAPAPAASAAPAPAAPTAAVPAAPASAAAPAAPASAAAPASPAAVPAAPPAPAAAQAPAAPTAAAAAPAPTAAVPAAPPAPAQADPAAPAVSKHAAGDAPAGWQANVVGKVPSEQIAPDDPGHTYHLLNDGTAIATTKPVTLRDMVTANVNAALGKKDPPANYDTLKGLAESMNPANVAAWSADGMICLKILKGPFEANWFKAKDCLLMDKWPGGIKKPDHSLGTQLMDGLVKMRTDVCAIVQKIAEGKIQAEVKKESQGPAGPGLGDAAVQGKLAQEAETNNDKTPLPDGKEKPGAQVEFKAPVGNQKRTSDIDTATGGMNTELAVALYNQLFRQYVAVPFEPGTMFDYNVYAMDWLHRLAFNKQQAPITKGPEKDQGKNQEVVAEIKPGNEHQIGDAADRKERDLSLEKASLLHIRRFMRSKAEWTKYSKDRLDKTPEVEKPELKKLLESVDLQFEQFSEQIKDRVAEIRGAIDAASNAHQSAWGKHNAHFQDSAVTTSASNRIYEERLREIKALRVQYQLAEAEALPEAEKKAKLVKIGKAVAKALSEALFFANEVYASEGATLHAVVGMQMAGKKNKEQENTDVKVQVPLTNEQWMQAFNENVGDSLKDFGHFGDNPPFAVYRAGKYMDRMCKAATQLTPKAATHPAYTTLSEVAAKSVRVKESAKGDDPSAAANVFKNWDEAKMEALRNDVLRFSTQVPTWAREEQRASPAPAEKAAEKPADAAPKQSAAANPDIQVAAAATDTVKRVEEQIENDPDPK